MLNKKDKEELIKSLHDDDIDRIITRVRKRLLGFVSGENYDPAGDVRALTMLYREMIARGTYNPDPLK